MQTETTIGGRAAEFLFFLVYPCHGKFAGPCAQGVLDPLMIPCPMSLGCAGLFVLFKDNAFLGTSAHESVITAGYLLDSRCRFGGPFAGRIIRGEQSDPKSGMFIVVV